MSSTSNAKTSSEVKSEEKVEKNVNNISDRERYDVLFAKLDKNGDGTVDIAELAAAFRGLGDGDAQQHAKTIMQRADKNANKLIDAEEFAQYMQQREDKLKIVFSSVDKNEDGMLEPAELTAALAALGINMSVEEVTELIERLDKNLDKGVDWSEWRDFFGIFPGDTLHELVNYWTNRPVIDIGEQLTCPPDVDNSYKGSTWRCLVSGAVAGAVSRTATAPLDRLKVMLQVYGGTKDMKSGGLGTVWQRMIKEGGKRSLWRGNGVSVAKIAPESAVKFGVYEQVKRWLTAASGHKDVYIYERFIAGAVAGSTAQSVIFPMEVIKTRLAISKTGQYNGMLDCARKIYMKEGLAVFYRGYVPNILGIIPYAGIDLTIYETLKIWYSKQNPDVMKPNILVLLACGSVSSTCGQVASYPFALVRTRLQAQATSDSRVSPWIMTRNIYQQDGVIGFYRGIIPNFIKVLPAVGISYVVYEQMKHVLEYAAHLSVST